MKYYDIDCLYDNGSTVTTHRRTIVPAESADEAVEAVRKVCSITLINRATECNEAAYVALLKERQDFARWNNTTLDRWMGWTPIPGAA